jgi:hypothetical protein
VTNASSTDWRGTLDWIERHLDAVRAGVEHGDACAAFAPPSVAAPLPADLADRAQALLERSRAVQRELEEELARIQAELRRMPRRPTTERATSRVDVGA